MTTGVIRSGNSTGIGTGTTKTEITPTAALSMPNRARALLAVKTSMGLITPTADQTAGARLDIESSDIVNMSPYEVLFAPIGSGDATGQGNLGVRFNGQESYRINAPLVGGDALHAYATALVANTVAPECQAFFIVSTDERSLMGQRHMHAKLGTFTGTTATADTDVAGTVYRFSNGSNIVELFGYFHPLAAAPGDMMIGEIKYKSTEFDNTVDVTLPLIPASVGLGSTVAWQLPGISRQEVNVPLNTRGQVNVQDYFNFGGALGAAGDFIDGVIYV